MKTSPPLFIAALSAGCLLTACRHAEPARVPPEGVIPSTIADRPQLPGADVRDIMVEKLAHAETLFEGMATGDHDAIAHSADNLHQISQDAEFRVHASLAYGVFSDQFGDITQQIADDARRRDMYAVSQNYMRMTETCIACHQYLRREGLNLDAPGRVSQRATAPPSLAWRK